MPLLDLPAKTLTTTTDSAGTVTLAYYISPPTIPGKPTVLLLHGFPDNVASYNALARTLQGRGYGVLGVDLLGYGSSDKPIPKDKDDKETLRKFAAKNQVDHWIAILDKEGIDRFVVIGHDWGSYMAGKVGMWYPERVLGVVFGNIAYFGPKEMDLDSFIGGVAQLTGVEHSGYMKFTSSGKPAAELIKANPKSFVTICYSASSDAWRSDFIEIGSLEAWLREGKTTELAPFIPQYIVDELYAHIAQDGLESALCMYTALADNIHWEVGEKDLPAERYILQPPCLMIAATRDWCAPKMFADNMVNTTKEVTIKTVDSGHWSLHEREEEWNEYVTEWLEKKGI